MIHPTAIIEDGVTLGENCEIAAYAIIKKGSILGDRVFVDHHAVVGGDPQDLSFDRKTKSGVRVGDRTQIREGVTIHRSTQPGGYTEVMEDAFLMANSHVGHDCVVGKRVILANGALLGGHVSVGAFSFLGGGAAFHQFVRVGESAMVSGNARIAYDVPPFVVAHERNWVSGLNLLGLKRRQFSLDEIRDLKNCFKNVFMSDSLNLPKNAAAHDAITDRGQEFLGFFSERASEAFVKYHK